jgi:cobyrinic acid a,c-diamide synthase
MPSSIYITAAHKSSGKTLVSLGIAAAFKEQSLNVQTFKKGPDDIDPLWLSQASGMPCYNLDFFNMSLDDINELYSKHACTSDLNIVEGNKGLYDGISLEGGDANADLAKLLNIPVILVIDATGITRGVAPLVSGYQSFDRDVNIAGVIFNKVAGERHESKLTQAIEHYTDVPVLGSIRKSSELIIDERHLGLTPVNESPKSQLFIDIAAKQIAEQVNLRSIIELQKEDIAFTKVTKSEPRQNIKVAVAKDKAFGFYYQDDIDAFNSLGVEIVYFDTLNDAKLPLTDGLFIGGGFPEMLLEELSSNTSLLDDIRNKIEGGFPAYAECGGLMYLTNKITHKNKSYSMAGVIDADTVMSTKPIGRGYVKLESNSDHPWPGTNNNISAHEFHYSKLENINPNTRYAYKVLRGVGVDDKQDGILVHNLLASYTHLRNVGSNLWVEQFVNFIKQTKGYSQ